MKATAKMPVCHFPPGVIQVVPIDNNLISTNANGFGGLEGIVRDYSVMHGRPGFLCYFNTAVHYEEKSFLSTCLLWQQDVNSFA